MKANQKKSDDERVKELLEAMTSETHDAPNDDKDAQELEEKFALGDNGDSNQAVQDANEVDDDDPLGGEKEDNSNPMKAPSGADVLDDKNPKKLFRGGKDIISIIIRGHR